MGEVPNGSYSAAPARFHKSFHLVEACPFEAGPGRFKCPLDGMQP
jgi:hypothetical protein